MVNKSYAPMHKFCACLKVKTQITRGKMKIPVQKYHKYKLLENDHVSV